MVIGHYKFILITHYCIYLPWYVPWSRVGLHIRFLLFLCCPQNPSTQGYPEFGGIPMKHLGCWWVFLSHWLWSSPISWILERLARQIPCKNCCTNPCIHCYIPMVYPYYISINLRLILDYINHNSRFLYYHINLRLWPLYNRYYKILYKNIPCYITPLISSNPVIPLLSLEAPRAPSTPRSPSGTLHLRLRRGRRPGPPGHGNGFFRGNSCCFIYEILLTMGNSLRFFHRFNN